MNPLQSILTTTQHASSCLTCISLDGAAYSSTDFLPMPVAQARVPQCCDERYVLLEGLQLASDALSNLQRRTGQLLEKFGTAAPPSAEETTQVHTVSTAY